MSIQSVSHRRVISSARPLFFATRKTCGRIDGTALVSVGCEGLMFSSSIFIPGRTSSICCSAGAALKNEKSKFAGGGPVRAGASLATP